MTLFTKDQEFYIEHEVQLRLHDSKFQNIDKAIDRLESSIRHLDNKLMLMFRNSLPRTSCADARWWCFPKAVW